MKIKAIKCLGCGDILISRARHDFHFCFCGKTACDGGFSYQKVCFDPNIGFEHVELDMPVTEQELYDDWNKGLDKFGVISEDKENTKRKLQKGEN